MKSASTALVTYLAAWRASATADEPLVVADLFTITLASGQVLTYTDFDVAVAWNGYTYAANSIMISGLRYKCSMGLNVDSQEIDILADSAQSAQKIGGVPFMQALRQGLFDGAHIQREKAFFNAPAGMTAPTIPLGTAILFKGRVSEIKEIGRTTAKATVASDLVLLDIDMPRNVYQANCGHVLYDTGCTVSRAACTLSGAAGSNSTLTRIYWTGALATHAQGAITFTSGQNVGAEATVKDVVAGAYLDLVYPLQYIPATGDTFSIAQGCDHTAATCANQFGNLANFRGFPYVPPPQVITGNMSSTYTSGK